MNIHRFDTGAHFIAQLRRLGKCKICMKVLKGFVFPVDKKDNNGGSSNDI